MEEAMPAPEAPSAGSPGGLRMTQELNAIIGLKRASTPMATQHAPPTSTTVLSSVEAAAREAAIADGLITRDVVASAVPAPNSVLVSSSSPGASAMITSAPVAVAESAAAAAAATTAAASDSGGIGGSSGGNGSGGVGGTVSSPAVTAPPVITATTTAGSISGGNAAATPAAPSSVVATASATPSAGGDSSASAGNSAPANGSSGGSSSGTKLSGSSTKHGSGGTAAAASSSKKANGLRRGKWTQEEEDYANRLIQEFKSGLLPLTDGTTLRTFLSKLLNCDPMRISKKFVGSNCIGKQVFRRRQTDMDRLTPEEIERSRAELADLERRFLERVAQTNRCKNSVGVSKSSAKDSSMAVALTADMIRPQNHSAGVYGGQSSSALAPWMMPPQHAAATAHQQHHHFPDNAHGGGGVGVAGSGSEGDGSGGGLSGQLPTHTWNSMSDLMHGAAGSGGAGGGLDGDGVVNPLPPSGLGLGVGPSGAGPRPSGGAGGLGGHHGLPSQAGLTGAGGGAHGSTGYVNDQHRLPLGALPPHGGFDPHSEFPQPPSMDALDSMELPSVASLEDLGIVNGRRFSADLSTLMHNNDDSHSRGGGRPPAGGLQGSQRLSEPSQSHREQQHPHSAAGPTDHLGSLHNWPLGPSGLYDDGNGNGNGHHGAAGHSGSTTAGGAAPATSRHQGTSNHQHQHQQQHQQHQQQHQQQQQQQLHHPARRPSQYGGSHQAPQQQHQQHPPPSHPNNYHHQQHQQLAQSQRTSDASTLDGIFHGSGERSDWRSTGSFDDAPGGGYLPVSAAINLQVSAAAADGAADTSAGGLVGHVRPSTPVGAPSRAGGGDGSSERPGPGRPMGPPIGPPDHAVHHGGMGGRSSGSGGLGSHTFRGAYGTHVSPKIMPRNSSIDDFLSLVASGDIPEPESDLLSNPISQSFRQSEAGQVAAAAPAQASALRPGMHHPGAGGFAATQNHTPRLFARRGPGPQRASQPPVSSPMLQPQLLSQGGARGPGHVRAPNGANSMATNIGAKRGLADPEEADARSPKAVRAT